MTHDTREAQEQQAREDELAAMLRVMGRGLTAPGLSDNDRSHIERAMGRMRAELDDLRRL